MREGPSSVSNEMKLIIISVPGHTWEEFKHCVQNVTIALFNFKQP